MGLLMPPTTDKRQQRKMSGIDQWVMGIDRVVRTISPGSTRSHRPSPAKDIPSSSAESVTLDAKTKRHIGGLMRINHTGEVCAQALYQGQALTAKTETIKTAMQASAKEEEDHLAWCEERLSQLGSRPSYLNPLFYGLSFGMGAIAGAAGDKWSLGFVAATEDQVCQHLRDHLQQLPEDDLQTRAILEQMLADEEHHGEKALEHGGVAFNSPSKRLMTGLSKLMTKTTYRI
jgi:ubiquinone biosynthesis monooxygenase Coq7